MEHLDKQTMDGTQLNLDALYQICPSCFTETAGENGQLKHVVNFEKLRELLGDNAVEDAPEVYDFTWVGKRAAQREAMAPCRKTLRPCPEESVDWDTTQNLYIEGDNLEVLKLLQNSYMGKVKMIYIDPPYNTGNDFVYHDDFHRTQREEDEAAGVINEEGERMVKNTESNGKFHSDWCSMIYSRLMVARSLLTEDGVIFISIGVEEFATLKSICNEVFGENNFVEVFSWIKTSTPPSLAVKSRKTNEYILCYEKNKNNIKYNGELLDGGDQPLLNTGNVESVLKFPKDKVVFKPKAFPNGVYEPYCKDRVSLLDRIEIVNGKATTDFHLKGEFKWTQSFFDEEVKNGTTFIIKTDNLSVRFIREGEGYKRPTNFIKEKITSPVIDKPGVGVGTNETASSYLTSLMDGKNVFSYPKPVSLIKYLTNFICKDSDIVMDFFSGSGTTADAVWRYNVENKEVALKYILVQLSENLDENLKTADANSKELLLNGIRLLDGINKPHKLTELAKYRLAKTIDSIKQDNSDCKMDLGFRVFKCDESNYKEVAFAPKDYNQAQLDLFVDNIKEDRTDLDLLFDCMLRWGVTLDLPMTKTKVDGCTIHNVNEGGLVACFDGKVTEGVIDAIAEMYPAKVVFRDSSFEEAAQKMNLFELFKQKCGWTEQEVRNNVRVI